MQIMINNQRYQSHGSTNDSQFDTFSEDIDEEYAIVLYYFEVKL